MKKALGNPARGEAFYPRNVIIEDILSVLHADTNLQMVAPRRVGKSSIMNFLLDNQPDDAFVFLLIDSEGIDNANQYFKLIYKEIWRNDKLAGLAKAAFKSMKTATKLLEKIKKLDIKIFEGSGSVEFHENLDDNHDYFEELQQLLRILPLKNIKIVMMVDEFPITIENILKKNNQDTAKQFLENNRRLRQDSELGQKMLFIYTGSIGLNNTVAKLEASITIGDLYSIEIPPLTDSEATDFIMQLLIPTVISDQNMRHLLARIQSHIPYYIQIVVEELRKLLRVNPDLNQNLIDTAIDKAVAQMSPVFKHWKERLNKTFDKNELKLALTILNTIAIQNEIDYATIQNMATGLKIKDLKQILGVLQHDGYLNNPTSAEKYHFLSPILKIWWQNHAN
jgi:hypothetical protein